MVYKIGDNIISGLGNDVNQIFGRIERGDLAGENHMGKFGLNESFFGFLLDWNTIEDDFAKLPHSSEIRYTKFEKIALLSAYSAIKTCNIDPSREDVVFVLSSTKGNVDLLENPDGFDFERATISASATLIGNYFGNPNRVMVVSNACTSGVVAQIYAKKMMEYKGYKHAIVIGADILNKFVVSGFQSFKALSTDRCKPFDQNRCGLNLGEGAATIVLEQSDIVPHGAMQIVGTGNRNDANHISGPSRTGEGLFNAISDAISSRPSIREDISFINAHGTATPYNDDMESWAIDRSGMRHIPVNSLKGCFGHTLGAAGILECIISCMALEKNIILPTYGHDTKGVAKEITVNKQLCTGRGDAFLKIISGFGGSNAAIIYRRQQ